MHVCEPGYDLEREEHVFRARRFGPAVSRCYEDELGRLWVTNDEYESQVNFCPFCGYRAKDQVKSETSDTLSGSSADHRQHQD
jgi:hypothetical protein